RGPPSSGSGAPGPPAGGAATAPPTPHRRAPPPPAATPSPPPRTQPHPPPPAVGGSRVTTPAASSCRSLVVSRVGVISGRLRTRSVKRCGPQEQVAHDQQRPALADDLEGPRQHAEMPVGATGIHTLPNATELRLSRR